MPRYQIRLTEVAEQQLAAVLDRTSRPAIARRIDGLSAEPDKQGKPLVGALAGYRSLRAAGQRYRIIYEVRTVEVVVYVVTIGRRKEGDKQDVYTLAQKLVQAGLLGPR